MQKLVGSVSAESSTFSHCMSGVEKLWTNSMLINVALGKFCQKLLTEAKMAVRYGTIRPEVVSNEVVLLKQYFR